MNQIIGIRPPPRPGLATFAHWIERENLISPPEAAHLIEKFGKQKLSPGTIGNGADGQAVKAESYRCVETCAVEDETWLYRKLTTATEVANNGLWRFNLSGIVEPIQFLRYTPEEADKPAGHYDWHVDMGGESYSTRKLSMIVQLSDEADYEGCDLEICGERGPWKVPYKKLGNAVLFPSYIPHRVLPITKGVRCALR